jgi:hypothetical protein
MVQPVLRVATAEELQRVLDFGAAVFCSHEPMCQALRPTPAEFVGQFAPLVEACCTSGLSYLVELHEKQDESSKRKLPGMSGCPQQLCIGSWVVVVVGGCQWLPSLLGSTLHAC